MKFRVAVAILGRGISSWLRNDRNGIGRVSSPIRIERNVPLGSEARCLRLVTLHKLGLLAHRLPRVSSAWNGLAVFRLQNLRCVRLPVNCGSFSFFSSGREGHFQTPIKRWPSLSFNNMYNIQSGCGWGCLNH